MQLRDGAAFEEKFVVAHVTALEAAEKEALVAGRRGRGRSRAWQRMIAYWAPRARRLILVRVDADRAGLGGVPGDGPEVEKIIALRAQRQPIFERGATSASA